MNNMTNCIIDVTISISTKNNSQKNKCKISQISDLKKSQNN